MNEASHVHAVADKINDRRKAHPFGRQVLRISSRRLIGSLAFVTLLALSLGACSSGSTPPSSTNDGAKPLDQVAITLAHLELGPYEEVYTYAVPKEMGFFAKQGIDATLNTADGSTAAIQRVLSGGSLIAYGDPISTILAAAKGAGVQAYAAQGVTFPYHIAVLPNSPIKDIKDFKGKSLGVTSLASNTYLVARSRLIGAGLNPDTDVKLVVVGGAQSSLAALQGGQVAGIVNYSDNFNAIKSSGAELAFLPDPASEKGLFATAFLATKESLSNPKTADIIARTTRAQFEGLVWSMANPTAAAQIACKVFPSIDCAGDKFKDIESEMVKSFVDVSPPFDSSGTPQTGAAGTWDNWGFLSDNQWQNEITFAKNSGVLSGSVTVDQVWNPSLIKKINDFDTAKVLAIKPTTN